LAARVSLFGEALFRFSTQSGERLRTASLLEFFLGGSELNIAANLKSLGVDADWISVLPEGAIGDLISDRAENFGLDLSKLSRSQGKAGWYLLESGVRPRPDKVISRNASLMSEIGFDFDWKKLLGSSRVFHTSGITAGLSEVCTSEIEKAMAAARSNGVKVSYDFNFRQNIWSLEESVRRQTPLLDYVDVLFCGAKELDLYFDGKPFDETPGKMIVMAERDASEKSYRVDILTRDSKIQSKTFAIENVDRIGVGDAMAAGFWAAQLEGKSLEETANFAAACGAMKYSIKGDVALLKKNEVMSLVSDGYRGVQR
jgi:2-dehydro-3-deoxygluconokinase